MGTADSVTAATSATAVTLSGATTGEGYVVCWMEKEGTSTAPVEETARLLTEEAAATDDEMDAADYHWQQAQTSGETLDFSIAFASAEGMVYDWGCMATSNNPVNPEFTSAAVWGTATTPDPVIEDTGAAYLWSTLIMAIFLAVFMF